MIMLHSILQHKRVNFGVIHIFQGSSVVDIVHVYALDSLLSQGHPILSHSMCHSTSDTHGLKILSTAIHHILS